MDWDDVRHFLALARSGSVRGAGATLGVSHSTIARRVEALEEQLGARLFDRSRDGYSLTEAGERLLPGAERIERELAAMERRVAGQDERLDGSIRITTTDPFVADVLLEPLGRLCTEHPGLELHLDCNRHNRDLSRREADLAIRAIALDATPPEHLIGTRLAPIVLANYVARAHAHRLDPDDPTTRWAGFSDAGLHRVLVERSHYPNNPTWGSFDSLSLMHRVARAGLGLVMLPTYVGDADPALQRLPHADLFHGADFWLLSHPDLRTNARLRAARRCLTEAFAASVDLFRGERPIDAPGRPENAPSTVPPDDLG